MKTTRSTTLHAAAFAGALVLGCNQTASAVALRTVALSGQPAPGTASGVIYNSFAEPVLNAAGRTAFVAYLDDNDGNPTNDNIGVWSEGVGTLALVARQGSRAPGTANGVNYNDFITPVLNAAGQTAFLADLAGSGINSTNNRGIWSALPGVVALVAREGNQAPGTASGVSYEDLNGPVFNALGQMSFAATLTGKGINSTNEEREKVSGTFSVTRSQAEKVFGNLTATIRPATLGRGRRK